MSAPIFSRVIRQAGQRVASGSLAGRRAAHFQHQTLRPALTQRVAAPARCLSVSSRTRAGIMPETDNPQPRRVEDPLVQHQQPAPIDNDDYHLRADEYMDAIHEKAEQVQEDREDVEVEYSAGVLSITLPPAGTYIINKQPPNKQIWLSSPTSGPKRYDWVLDGESMHEKEGGGEGDWVYLRDGSSLTELLRKELGLTLDLHGHEDSMKQKVDPTE